MAFCRAVLSARPSGGGGGGRGGARVQKLGFGFGVVQIPILHDSGPEAQIAAAGPAEAWGLSR